MALDRAAKEACARNEPAEAVRLWSKALALLEDAGAVSGMSNVLHAMGQASADGRDLNKALSFWQRALELDQRLGNLRNQAVTLACMVAARAMLGDFFGAMELASRAIPLLEQAGDPRALLTGLNNIARVAIRLDRQAAEVILKRMIEVSDLLGDDRAKAAARDALASMKAPGAPSPTVVLYQDAKSAEEHGDRDLARNLLNTMLQLCGKNEDLTNAAVACMALGRLAFAAEDWSEAGRRWMRAIDYLRGTDAVDVSQNCRHMAAMAVARSGDADQALALLDASREIDRARGVTPQDAPDVLDAIADAMVRRGNSALAISLWEMAMEGYRRAGNLPYRAKVLNSMAELVAARGDVPKALALLDEAGKILADAGLVLQRATVISNRGNIIAKAGQPEAAIDYWQAAADLQRHVGDHRGQAISMENVGNALVTLGRPTKALPFYQQVLKLYEQLDDEGGKQRVLESLSMLAHGTN